MKLNFIDKIGNISELSKTVNDGEGESVGINKIIKKDRKRFIKNLEKIANTDYFERGIETMIASSGTVWKPVFTQDYFVQEIDFQEDLKAVQKHIKESSQGC